MPNQTAFKNEVEIKIFIDKNFEYSPNQRKTFKSEYFQIRMILNKNFWMQKKNNKIQSTYLKYSSNV